MMVQELSTNIAESALFLVPSGTPVTCSYMSLQHTEKWLKACQTRLLGVLLNSGFRFEFCITHLCSYSRIR